MATRQMLIGTIFGPQPIYQGEGLAKSFIMLAAAPGEEFASADTTFGIGNIWSIETWVYWSTSLPVGNQSPFTLLPSSGNVNDIAIGTNGGTGEISILSRDSAASNLFIKRYAQNSWTVDAWNMLTVTRNSGDAGDTHVFMNGTELTPSGTSTDNAGTMTDTSRILSTPPDNGHDWDGFMFCTTLWSSALTQPEIQYRFDNRNGLSSSKGWLDPTVNQGDYESASTCVHWYPYVLDAGDLGADAQGANDLTGTDISGTSTEVP